MKPQLALVAGCLIACLGACASDAPRPAPAPGSDRDAQGCIASAGYAWCAATRRCERPWELARQQGFGPTAQAFDAFCKNRSVP